MGPECGCELNGMRGGEGTTTQWPKVGGSHMGLHTPFAVIVNFFATLEGI